GCCIAYFDRGAEMLSMNAAAVSTSGEHHQDGLCLRVRLIVLEVENHSQLRSVKHLGPMAVFARIPGWNQTTRFHRRWNRLVDAVKDNLHQLTSTGRLSPHESGCTRANVAIHTVYLR